MIYAHNVNIRSSVYKQLYALYARNVNIRISVYKQSNMIYAPIVKICSCVCKGKYLNSKGPYVYFISFVQTQAYYLDCITGYIGHILEHSVLECSRAVSPKTFYCTVYRCR